LFSSWARPADSFPSAAIFSVCRNSVSILRPTVISTNVTTHPTSSLSRSTGNDQYSAGNGYEAALLNFRMMASSVQTTDEMVAAFSAA